MWTITLRADAKNDLKEAREWYERQEAGLGDQFFLSITDAMIRLEEAPKQFPVYYREFRRILTDKFPFKIFFKVENDEVIIFRILHSARDHTLHLR